MNKLSELRKRFYSETLTKEDFEQVTLSESIKIELYELIREAGGTFLIINYNNNYVKQSGDLKGKLDKRSWDFIKSKPYEPLFLDTLEIRMGSDLWGQEMEGGFYHYNSRRQYPECILCFKEHYGGNIF